MSPKAIIVGVIMFCIFCPWLTPFWIIIGVILGITFGGIVQEEEDWYSRNHDIIMNCSTCKYDNICTLTMPEKGCGCSNWKEKIGGELT